MNQNNPDPCEMAEVIYEKPLSGKFEEVLFGSAAGNTLWVKFSDQFGVNEWIGKFEVGGSGSGWVAKYNEPDKFFVSAGGTTYLIEASSRKLISQFRNDNFCETIFDPQRKLVIAADYSDLHWVDLAGKILFSRKISVDGICNLRIVSGVLTGLAYRNYDNEQKFWFDLNGLKILRWEKPWWKFW